MRTLIMSCCAVGLIAATAAHAQSRRPVRTALVITMTGSEPEARHAPPPAAVSLGATSTSSASAEAASTPGSFRVHDLSRRWVEYQMASAFSPQPSGPAPTSEDPFASVGVAQLEVPAFEAGIAPVSAIPVPLWMRGGSLFAAAAATYVPGCAPTEYRPSGLLSSDAEYRRRGFYGLMANIACQYGLPVGLFDAMIIRESRYNASIYSPKKAFGLTQLMPGTAAGLGVNRYDVEQNLKGGARYLREQLDRFGQYHLALAAYNAGPGRVRNGTVPRIVETQDYVSNILLNWSKLTGASGSNDGRAMRFGPSGTPVVSRSAVVTSF
ncbi:lytic transglycosylase domain-containing protein [Sphingobium yanoikuyae]|uniref:lytic transglycosylase domain-containing protein n=1 Tax=Sphingobium yanoikuyae TaxID=13690 RepID=UPI00056BC68D|nr:lytic transglycosylase domain-containing protein [Sphingobium yanoikuyae]